MRQAYGLAVLACVSVGYDNSNTILMLEVVLGLPRIGKPGLVGLRQNRVANPDQLSTNDPLMFKEQEIKYNFFNRVESYRLDNDRLEFDYRPDASKWRTRYYEDDVLQYTKYHHGTHEKVVYADGTTKNLFYIFGARDLAAICVREGNSTQMNYAITDHLGSIWALANEQGQLVEKYAYDPWGKRVDPDDWTQNDLRTEFITDRGFTMHEHFDAMQIIYMNARLYDPLLGQFISVDPLADKYPGLGAYVYCANNPLRYTDPTGMDFWSDIGDLFSNMVSDIEDLLIQMEDAIAQVLESFDDILEESFDGLWDTSEWGLDGKFLFDKTNNFKSLDIRPYVEIDQELVQSQVTQEVLITRVESGNLRPDKGVFPLDKLVDSYKKYPGQFGDSRGKRKHGGADLYAPVGTPVYAVKDGVIIKNPYKFYKGSYAIEVNHGNFIARYSEINVKSDLKAGFKVLQGQYIGTIADLSLKNSMLHFEMYSGMAKGPLTNRSNPPYMRRSDLINPTHFLDYGY